MLLFKGVELAEDVRAVAALLDDRLGNGAGSERVGWEREVESWWFMFRVQGLGWCSRT